MREMKDSGTPWTGRIPSTWSVSKIKYLLIDGDDGIKIGPFGSAIKGKTLPDGPIKIYNQANVIANDFDLVRHFVSEESYQELRAYEIQPGDILFSMMGTIGKCCIMPDGKPLGIMDSHLLKARINHKILPRFFVYAYDKDNNEETLKQLLYMSQGSIMNGLNSAIIKSTVLALPPLPEQSAIVAYLDSRCAKIDEAIYRHKQIIEKLEEYRKSVITQAVTKGLDPNVEMKDSGNQYVGRIPMHWDICKMLYILQMPITDGPHTTPELYDYGVPFVSAEAVSQGNGHIDFSHIRGYISEEFYEECCKKYIPQVDDVYMIKSGATTGKVAIVDTDVKFTIWSPLAVMRTNQSKVKSKYLYYFLQSKGFQTQVELGWTYGTQQNIGMRTIERLKICFPNVAEQEEIICFLDGITDTVNTAIAKQQTAICKLEEYRKSIIYNAVTGKIDCRSQKGIDHDE